jgi:hypothetical protein
LKQSAEMPLARPPKPGTHSSRRVNKLARALTAKTYLEVGVAHGDTFFAVEIASKTAVDPKFRFDPADFAGEGMQFRETASDEFFLAAGQIGKFDIVFLDGLHSFEQTFRDFCNALALAHDRTAILIDDTLPLDIYSSLPDQRSAIRFRRGAGLKGTPWHGDVYKVVFAIHDFFPMYNFRTITGSGNPQTLVWREPRREFKPVYNNLEAISRMGYFDMKDRIWALQPEGEVEALQRAIEVLQGQPKSASSENVPAT